MRCEASIPSYWRSCSWPRSDLDPSRVYWVSRSIPGAVPPVADHMENTNLGPFEAVLTTGAGRLTSIAYALVPDVLPVLLSTTLFWWEFNVRASTVLGVVGAGGIGQELKNSMDLLD